MTAGDAAGRTAATCEALSEVMTRTLPSVVDHAEAAADAFTRKQPRISTMRSSGSGSSFVRPLSDTWLEQSISTTVKLNRTSFSSSSHPYRMSYVRS